MAKALAVDLHRLARFVNTTLLILPIIFFAAGYFLSFWFHFLTVASLFLLIVNFFYRHVQKQHTLLGNFGVLGQARYLIESVGPEFRQYLFLNDREERPFNRAERSEIYRKAKNVESAGSFGTLLDYGAGEIKLRHSMFPTREEEALPFRVAFGEARSVARPYTIEQPMIISAMSYGALGSPAARIVSCSLQSDDNYYLLALNRASPGSYTLTASPTGSHNDAECGNLTLASNGERGSSTGTLERCW